MSRRPMSMALSERLRSLRKERGLSQETVARRADIGLKAYGELERGIATDPHFSTLAGIARALGLTVAEVVGEKPNVPLDELSPGETRLGPKHTVYKFSEEPRVTREQLAERGIEVNNSELRVLSQYIDLQERPASGPVAVGYVRKEDEPVDSERVKTLLAYVLASDMLTKEATAAVRESLEKELATA
jgi:transcriptional regulator with XRE-family HTH domain